MTVVTEKSRLWAKRSAVYTLSQRGMSVSGLRDKIYERAMRKYEGIVAEEAHELAKTAIDFCLEMKFLDDAVYTDSKISEGIRRGHSRRKIQMTLADKGIARDDAVEAVSDIDDLEAALVLARKKGYGPWRRVEGDQKRIAKEAAGFARNGFSSSMTWKVIRMSMEEVDEVEEEMSAARRF